MRVLLATVVTVGVAASSSADAASRSLFAGADPSAEMIDGRLWIYPTGRGDTLQAWTEADGRWAPRGDLLRLRDISWARADRAPKHYLWAPDLLKTDRGYLLYYSVGPQDFTPSRIGVARCESPAGPCTDSGKPLLTGGRGFEAIDPMVFDDPVSGKRYLYAGGSNGARLRAFVLGDDPTVIDREIAMAQPPQFTEGAFMHERDGTYYLSYSSGVWNGSSYSVHYATGPSPIGPWRYRGVILSGDRRYKGPGHHSFFRTRDGAWSIAYHRWEGKRGNGPYSGDRRIVVQPISYDADGSILPVVMDDR